MKLAIGYAIGFFVVAILATLVLLGAILGVMGILVFVFWQLPLYFPYWGFIRLAIALGVITSIFFCFSDDGKQLARNATKWFDKKGWLK